MKPVLFLDMDDVVSDFVTGVSQWFSLPVADRSSFSIAKVFNVQPAALQGILHAIGRDVAFWEAIPKTEWADQVMDFARRNFDQIFFATTPTGPASATGKMKWLRHHYGIEVDHVFVNPHKWFLSAPGRLLLDDSPSNCTRWDAHGGTSVLFPALHHGHAPTPNAVAASLLQAFHVLR